MSYPELYEYCQTLTPKVRRNDIRQKVLELTGIPKVAIMATPLDTSICRGFYLSASNANHRLVQQHGSHVIVVAQEIFASNECWTRFIIVKELMHLFDDPNECTDSGEAFERILADLSVQDMMNASEPYKSEIKCFWMALAALCPEKQRLEFAAQRAAGHIDDYGIALQLKIPQQYVPHLFKPTYPAIVQQLSRTTLATQPGAQPQLIQSSY